MSLKQGIFDSTGMRCGFLETTLCQSEQDLEDCICFSTIPGGFAQYRNQVPLAEIWPMAFINNIEVYEDHQRRGLARNALEVFLGEVRQKGARIAFLRVGWYGENPDQQRAWRIGWYSRMGFIELVNTAPHFSVPLMYRSLEEVST